MIYSRKLGEVCMQARGNFKYATNFTGRPTEKINERLE